MFHGRKALCVEFGMRLLFFCIYKMLFFLWGLGMVATDMTARWGTSGCITTEESVLGLLARTDALNLKNSGKFFHENGQELPW